MEDWISTLVQCEFFTSCVDHQRERKNEKNIFCIECCLSLCRHCMYNHGQHRCFQIWRYTYSNVIRLEDLEKHFDCSGIQTYIANRKKAIHIKARPNLPPRPPSKDKKLTDSDPNSDLHQKDERLSIRSRSVVICEGCGRYLLDMQNHFCSIACKVSTTARVNQSHDFFTIPVSDVDNLPLKDSESNKTESSISVGDSSAEVADSVNTSEHLMPPKKRLNKRKGIPCRAASKDDDSL